jgi:hypothetical protein
MMGQVKELTTNNDIQETLRIANDWGMNRRPEPVTNPVNSEKVLDSLFTV